jgi:CheY-like chemotaxis protein
MIGSPSTFPILQWAAKNGPPLDLLSSAVSNRTELQPTQIPRILIVEDEYLVAMTLENDLTEAGYQIAGIASSADEASQLVHTERPTLIVMDIRLLGSRDGVDAALQIYAETGVRCIFATANADERSKQRAIPAHPLGWLQKPFHRAALLSAIENALDELSGPSQ